MKFIILFAISTCIRWCSSNPTPRELESNYLAALQNKKFSQAQHILADLRDQLGDSAVAKHISHFHFHLGLHQSTKGEYADAIISMETALKYYPDNQDILLTLGNLYLEHLQFYEAIQVYQTMNPQQEDHRHREIYGKIARAWAGLGEYLIAINELKAALVHWPDQPELLAQMAGYLLKNRAFQETVETLTKLTRVRQLSSLEQEILRQATESVKMESGYDESVSANFHVWIQDAKVGSYRYEVLRYLEEVYNSVGERFNFYPREITRVSMLSDHDFRGLVKVPDQVIGVSNGVSQEIQIPLDRVRGFKESRLLKNVLFHEYAHHVIRLATQDHASVPIWFHEGVATFLEPYRNLRNEEKTLQKLVLSNKLAVESDYKRAIFEHTNPSDYYVQAASMIAFLEERQLLSSLLQNLSSLRNNLPFDDLFLKITSMRISEFFAAWNQWIPLKLKLIEKKGD